jgi:hypothetical protein
VTTTARAGHISPDDIKSKLQEIQGEATQQVESAKNQIVVVGGLVALLVLMAMFLLGRRSGKRSTAIIEVRRG